ncbi:MAG: threonine synthase [Bacteroidaceae bacterium]|nr:threonine synthase [Bacteroidaceae bacterium]
MQYYSTNNSAEQATLREAVIRGLAPDRGLYMPEVINHLPADFFDSIQDLTFQEVAYRVADAFFGEDVPAADLRAIVYDTLQFDTPVVQIKENIYALELFHGPTLAFKDVGARFMARLLQYFVAQGGEGSSSGSADEKSSINVLVATSGDTGSAVANGFLGVDGIHVYVLYPKGKVSPIQECQFTTLGKNITAIEVDGVFDDCQALVKSAFMDQELNAHMRLTSANSINVARFLPQAFYYFWAYAQLKKKNLLAGREPQLVFCVPSGNFGNICSALFGHEMGLPVKRFIAANNANDIFYKYLQSGIYTPKASIQTIANAMDVGDPSNFARILRLYKAPTAPVAEASKSEEAHKRICSLISGCTYADQQISETMRQCYADTNYVLDPHGACGYRALTEQLQPGEIGVFLETAHPAKFKDTVDSILGIDQQIPAKLQAFMEGTKQSVPMSRNFADFKSFLLKE